MAGRWANVRAASAVVLAAFAVAGCAGGQPRTTTTAPGVEGRPIGAAPTRDAQATAVALRFLDGYLAVAYGRGRVADVRGATPALLAQLRRQPSRVPPAQRARQPRVVDLQLGRESIGAVRARATVDDGDVAPYPLFLTLRRTPPGWAVSSVGD